MLKYSDVTHPVIDIKESPTNGANHGGSGAIDASPDKGSNKSTAIKLPGKIEHDSMESTRPKILPLDSSVIFLKSGGSLVGIKAEIPKIKMSS